MTNFKHPSLALLPDLAQSDNGQLVDDERYRVLDQVRRTLADFLEQPGDEEKRMQFVAARRNASAVIARFPRKRSQDLFLHEVHELVREMAKSGVHDCIASVEDQAHAQVHARRGWPGVLAAMLLVPAWQWLTAPLLIEVPDWLRADYVRWLFAAPQNFTVPGQAEAYAEFVLKRLTELVRWMNRGPGEKEELQVLGAYAGRSTLLPAGGGTDSLRRHAELRGQLLVRAMGRRDDLYFAPAKPRTGRRLRIGIIHRHFAAQPEIFATLPLFEQLDPERFEVVLFTYVSDFNRVEDYCRQKAADMFVLPADLNAQLVMLRNAALDVMLFSGNVTAECTVVTRLALHRVAPLQVVSNSSGITSGLPEIDLYVAGALSATEGMAAQFTERLGLMSGPTHAFNFTADGEEAQVACSRADFGLPTDGFVFVTTVDFRKIVPEMQQAWARLLAAVPDSSLLVHPFGSNRPSDHTISRFHAEFERTLRGEAVNPERLVVSMVEFPSRTDLRSLVGLGDVYLDAYPCSGVDSLVDALALGLPVVAREGAALRSRTGGSLLRALEMSELIADSASDYERIAVKLATEPVYRESCRGRIQACMEQVPVFLDASVTSRTFGELIESAYDELVAQGRVAFRTNLQPLRAINLEPQSATPIGPTTG